MKKKILLVIVAIFFLSSGIFSQGAPACPSISPTATPSTVCVGQCSNLNATVVSNNQTTNYTVGSIPYSPYPYSGGTAISVGTDDVWSGVLNIGFTFCYFGSPYTQFLCGSNGHITFDMSSGNINGYDAYPVTTPLPSLADMPGNTINAVFRDIDPSVSGSIAYYTTGTAPCRALVIYWKNVALYSCGTPHSYFQLVLYENTNFIDVYVQNSSGTCSWENGNGIIGLLNAAGTVAVCPPGRNCTNWTATNEAWRFTPAGAPSYNITWTGPSGVVGTGLGPVNVCPTTNTTYTASMVITDCNNATTTYTNTTSITVTPGGPTITVNSPTICAGGSAALNASGATTYTWSPGTGLSGTSGASVTANPATTTVYTITGSSGGGCTGTKTTTVTVGPTPTVTVNSSTVCPGVSTTLTATGASTYTWSPATGLSATTGGSVVATPTATTVYTISATSAGGCTTTATSTVTIGGSITPTVNSATICPGASATLNAGGATTYTWSPGTGLSATTGASVTANPATTTTYTITGTAGGCTGTVTSVVTVSPNPTVTVNSPTICIGNSSTVNAAGASTYSWSPATGLSATTGASVTANPTVTTTYTVTGTTSTCTSTATSIVTVNPLPTVTVNSATICPGASATLTATGASTYIWTPSATLSSSTGTSVTANPASTTTYTITGTSAAGCTATATSTVTVGGSISPSVASATICAGSSTTLNASGATTYTWSPGTGLSATTGASVTANPATTTTYTITGASGACSGTTTAVVTVSPLPTVAVNSPSICINASTTLNATGASTYSWSSATGLSATTGASVTANPTVTTTYTIVGTSATCTSSATSTVTVNPLPTVTVNSATVCPGATATLTAAGASTYAWSTGATGASITDAPVATTNYTVTGTSGAGCVNTATASVTVLSALVVSVNSATICQGTSATLTANGATTYSWSPSTGLSSSSGTSVTANPSATTIYTVTGSSGTCSATATSTVSVNPLPTVTVNSAAICVGQQTANLTASGASTYSWNPSTGLSASSGTSVTATPTVTTAYTVTGTDANGCVSTATTAVIVNPLPNVTVSSATICPTFSATLTASGASTYLWNTGATGSSLTASPATTTTYSVVGTDVNGCVSGNTATITVNPTLLVSAGNNTPVCEGSTINLTATTGIVWSWTGPGGYTSNAQNPSITNATPAMSGTYSVTATDANGCQGNATTNVTVNALPAPTIGSNGPVCVNQTLSLNSGGGTAYSWNGPGSFVSTQQNPTITGVTATAGGVYTVTVTDANLCVNTTTLNVVVNPLPVVSVTGSTVCVNATINLTAGGGTGYSWSGPSGFISNQQNPSITNATNANAGTYVVTVTDGNNCVNANVANVVVNPLPSVSATADEICAGKTTTITASGASTYNWSPATGLSSASSSSPVASPTTTTTYTVVGTDVNGCQGMAVTTITVTPGPAAVVTPTLSSGCAPVCATFSNTANGVGNYNWTFGNGQTSSSTNPTNCYTVAGNYTVTLTITDAQGCTGVSTATVNVYPVPDADFSASPQPTTILDNTVHFHDETTGGAMITSWDWNLGNGTTSIAQNPSCLYGDTGTYAVQLVVTSNHGCKDSVIHYIRVNDEFSLYVPNAFSPNADGVNDVFYAKGEGIRDFKMYIYDRWGNQVFFSDDIYKGWDGRYQSKGTEIVQEDVYVWKIQCKTPKGEKKQLSGHVSLIK